MVKLKITNDPIIRFEASVPLDAIIMEGVTRVHP